MSFYLWLHISEAPYLGGLWWGDRSMFLCMGSGGKKTELCQAYQIVRLSKSFSWSENEICVFFPLSQHFKEQLSLLLVCPLHVVASNYA